ncbi:M48 family metallopeptidase [Reinekea marinisedimentorum]|nr:SprT family zinc-dependent metalloprotease [Reinekea marinisedimentorum]
MNPKLFWRDQAVAMTLSRRKTMALHVRENSIEVRAPYRTPIKLAQTFVDDHDQWIERKLSDIRKRKAEKPDLMAASHIPFMGLNVALNIEQGAINRWQLAPEGLNCTLTDKQEQLLPLLGDFYKKQAQFWLNKKTLAVAEGLGFQNRISGIRLRKTKTKWGHCSASGQLQYNWLIMMAPEAVIDYLVAHEVAHLEHLNHSASFWQLVAQIQPGFDRNRRWLSDHGHRLTLT